MTTLDTSGFVKNPRKSSPHSYQWSDLSPFVQGYVEALFAEARPGYDDAGLGGHYVCGFSDLAPEALAMILRDCGERYAAFSWQRPSADASERKAGAMFWEQRQRAEWIDRLVHPLPPLRIYLNNAGKVMLEISK